MTRIYVQRYRALAVMAGMALASSTAIAQTAPAAIAQTAPAADSDTIYFGQKRQEQAPTLWLAPVHGYVDLIGNYNSSHISSDGVNARENGTLFQEELTLYTNGYIVHPNLVDMRFSITGGLEQDYFSTDQESGSANSTLYGWDIGVTFLRNEQGSLTLYSRRSESTFDVPFGPTEKLTTMTTGATLDYSTEGYSSQLDAFHEEDTQSGISQNNSGYSQTRDVVTGYGNARLSSTQTLNWMAGWTDNHFDSEGTSNEQQTTTGSLYHTAVFGENGRCSLTSSVGYTSQTGYFEANDFNWREHLHVWHTPDLETNYDYAYENQSFGGAQTESQFASADARYQLYNSLTTLGRISWLDVSSGDTSIQTYLANLSFNYAKKATDGTLYADMQLAREQQDINGSGPITVSDQPTAFAGIDPITVNQPNAIPSSVLLRDANSGRIYQEGIDYTVTSNPLGMQINRVLGGNIPTGQPLFLTYDYDPLNANEIVSNIFGLGGRYQFTKGPLAGLTPYAKFLAQNQTVKGGTAESNDVRDYIVGASYTVGELTLFGQREWFDSTLYPFESWRGEADWLHAVSSSTNVTLSAIFTETQYHQPDEQSQSYGLNASLSHRFSTHLSASLYAAYTYVETQPGGHSAGMEEGAEVDWNFRDTKVYMRVRNSGLNSNVSDQSYQFIQVGLSRSF